MLSSQTYIKKKEFREKFNNLLFRKRWEQLESFRQYGETFTNDKGVSGIKSYKGSYDINNNMIEDAPPLRDALPTLIEFIGSSPIVGQNLDFDYTFFIENHQDLHPKIMKTINI